MANEQPLDKPAATDRKPARNQARQPQQPQVRSPLLNDGPELERDSHC
ncbi:hypothetical protein [Bradyrhizobium paxllaeri]|nr:hypothetical protein [Bradyrhizobium paxllaeri]